MSVNVETGIAFHAHGSGSELKIDTLSVTTSSVILITPEVHAAYHEETIVLFSRTVGTGFSVLIANEDRESYVDWAVIN